MMCKFTFYSISQSACTVCSTMLIKKRARHSDRAGGDVDGIDTVKLMSPSNLNSYFKGIIKTVQKGKGKMLL